MGAMVPGSGVRGAPGGGCGRRVAWLARRWLLRYSSVTLLSSSVPLLRPPCLAQAQLPCVPVSAARRSPATAHSARASFPRRLCVCFLSFSSPLADCLTKSFVQRRRLQLPPQQTRDRTAWVPRCHTIDTRCDRHRVTSFGSPALPIERRRRGERRGERRGFISVCPPFLRYLWQCNRGAVHAHFTPPTTRTRLRFGPGGCEWLLTSCRPRVIAEREVPSATAQRSLGSLHRQHQASPLCTVSSRHAAPSALSRERRQQSALSASVSYLHRTASERQQPALSAVSSPQ